MGPNGQPRVEALWRETLRQGLHIAAALFIIPLRWLGFKYAIGFAVIAFFWNLLAMPGLFRATLRADEKAKGYSPGMLAYSVSILVLAVFFPVPVLAAAWAVLSVSDGLATLSGKLFGKKPLCWNKDKTWTGSIAFFSSATVFGWLAFLMTAGNPGSSPIAMGLPFPALSGPPLNAFMVFAASLGAALISALAESLPLRKINDNLLAPVCYALTLALLLKAVAALVAPA